MLQLSLVGGSGYVPAGLEWSHRDAENLVLAWVNSRMNESECLQWRGSLGSFNPILLYR